MRTAFAVAERVEVAAVNAGRPPLPAGAGQQPSGDALADGLTARGGEAVAGRLDLSAAAVVIGDEVVLAASGPQAALRARLQADREGRPDALLADGGGVALASVAPVAVPAAFAPTAVPAGPVRLTLIPARGAAVAMPGESGTILLRTDGPDFASLPPTEGRGIAAALRFAGTAAEPATGLVLRLGGLTLPVANGVADLTPALASPFRLLLEVSADFRAVVSLDPPVLRYSLALRCSSGRVRLAAAVAGRLQRRGKSRARAVAARPAGPSAWMASAPRRRP